LEFFKSGEPEKAIPILETVTELVPTFVIAHVLLAQAYESTLQEEKAVQAWRRAYRMIPNSPLLPRTQDESVPPDPFLASIESVATKPGLVAASEKPAPLTPVEGTQGVLRVQNLVKRYRKKSVVKAVELEVRQGEIVGLLGPNGAGKTTTFYMMVGMIRSDGGTVELDGRDITRLPMYERARLGIGYLAQEASIFTHLTVEENILAVLEYQHLRKNERKERMEGLILEFGLERVRRSKGYMLSGGERRRTECTRTRDSTTVLFTR
jgi:ABC-type glutathione transport system ATPase component